MGLKALWIEDLLLVIVCSVGGNLVTWHNRERNVVVRSSAEVKFRALAYEICE